MLFHLTSVLPRVHGSGLFKRGETQVLSAATLGGIGDAQVIDGIGVETEKRYMHHYNFPPYSVGEARPIRSPGRREIGHGALAERALLPVLPSKEDFPYTIRVVSDVLSSNGSTSQASVCGSCMALMDAGVPIKAPVAGIAMGLIERVEEDGIRDDRVTGVQTCALPIFFFISPIAIPATGALIGTPASSLDRKSVV